MKETIPNQNVPKDMNSQDMPIASLKATIVREGKTSVGGINQSAGFFIKFLKNHLNSVIFFSVISWSVQWTQSIIIVIDKAILI